MQKELVRCTVSVSFSVLISKVDNRNLILLKMDQMRVFETAVQLIMEQINTNFVTFIWNRAEKRI